MSNDESVSVSSKDESPVVFNLRQIAASDIARWDIRNHIAAAADEIERLARERDSAREALRVSEQRVREHWQERDRPLAAIGEHVTVRSDQYQQIDRLKAALLELVACKALREKIDGELCACHQETSPQLQAMENEYQLRKPLAWRDARAALNGEPESGAPRREAGDRAGPEVSRQQLQHLLLCVEVELNHARRFVSSAESMRPDGIEQYDMVLKGVTATREALNGECSANETEARQAPIVHVMIKDGEAAYTLIYSPGLPDGQHDLYCEPEAIAPMMRDEPLCQMSPAAADVIAERLRQLTKEGWTPEHDNEHDMGELAEAAACYALKSAGNEESLFERWWPWSRSWWKPKGRRRDLVHAGALILAEIERLDRKTPEKAGDEP